MKKRLRMKRMKFFYVGKKRLKFYYNNRKMNLERIYIKLNELGVNNIDKIFKWLEEKLEMTTYQIKAENSCLEFIMLKEHKKFLNRYLKKNKFID